MASVGHDHSRSADWCNHHSGDCCDGCCGPNALNAPPAKTNAVKRWLDQPANFRTTAQFLTWSLQCVTLGILLAGWVGLGR